MRIGIADNNGGKFSKDIQLHWESLGHEVRFERGASEYIVQWADVYFVDTWDNNIHYLYKLYHGVEGVSRPVDWDNNKKSRIIVRALDWEVWIGLARSQEMIDWVDDVIVIAPHIEKELRKYAEFGSKIHLICPGVNLAKFPLKTKQTDGFQLGMALGDMWKYKNHMGGLDIFTTLYQKDKRWRLHIRGQHENSMYDPTNYEYYLESRGIKDVVTLYPHMQDMNEFYENIDILLHPGQKEAFCYSVGEALAKGIPAIVNDFYGSHDIWQYPDLYKTHAEAVEFIKKASFNTAHREYIEKNHNMEQMLKEFDRLIGI